MFQKTLAVFIAAHCGAAAGWRPDGRNDRTDDKAAEQNFVGELFEAVVVDVESLAENAAHDAAERNLTASKESLKGIKGFFSKLWKHGM